MTNVKGTANMRRPAVRTACALLMLVLVFGLIAGVILPLINIDASAEDLSTVYTNQEGASFGGKVRYELNKSIPSFSSFTIEAEVHISPDFPNNESAGVIIGNYHDSANRDNTEWNLEIRNEGTLSFLFLKDGTNIETYFSIGADGTHANQTGSNSGKATDIRTYMGTDANPKYAKISLTMDTGAGKGILYINGNQVVTADISALKDYTFPESTKWNHCIGGDNRTSDSNDDFKGKIRNVSMYNYARTASEAARYAASTGFNPNASDSNLLFAFDMRKVSLHGNVTDLSSKGYTATDLSRKALNVNYEGTPDTRPPTTGNDDTANQNVAGANRTIPANIPLVYLYVDDDGDGTAVYDSAWTQLNGNDSNAPLMGAFWRCNNICSRNNGDRYTFYIRIMGGVFYEYTPRYNNMCFINGDVYIDFNNYGIVVGSKNSNTYDGAAKTLSYSVFSAECKGSGASSAYPTVNFFNSNPKPNVIGNVDYSGLLLNNSEYPLIETKISSDSYASTFFTAGTGSTSGTLKNTNANGMNFPFFSYNFYNIRFKGGKAIGNPFVNFSEAQYIADDTTKLPNGMLAGLNVTFNECRFDLTQATSLTELTLFDAKDNNLAINYTSNSGSGEIVVNTVVNMTVNGGRVITDSNTPRDLIFTERHHWTKLEGVSSEAEPLKSEVKFGKGQSGNYVIFSTGGSYTPPTDWQENWLANIGEDGVGVCCATANEAGDNTLTFATPNANTPNDYYFMPSVQYEGKGNFVPARTYYGNNFAVFQCTMDASGENGDWVYIGGGNTLFNGAANDGIDKLYIESGSYNIVSENTQNRHLAVVMTKDCTLDTNSKYSNFGQIRGKLTYDLGGHTLTWNTSTRLINAEAKAGAGGNNANPTDPATGLYHSTRFEMKNGTFITKGASVVALSASGDYPGGKVFDLDFTDVTFKKLDDTTSMQAFFVYHDNAVSNNANMKNQSMEADITFTDCTFDLTNSSSFRTRTLFNATDTGYNTYTDGTENWNTNTIARITVNGGVITSDNPITDFGLADCYNINNTDDVSHHNRADEAQGASVTFGKSACGTYPSLLLPEGSTMPIQVFDKNTGRYLGDLNVSSNTNTARDVGSLHVYSTDKKDCTNNHTVSGVTCNDVLTYTLGTNEASEVLYSLEPSREVDGDVGQNHSVYVPAYYYDDPTTYPIYVFDDGKCVGVYTEWGYAAANICTFDNGIIFLRRDYVNDGTGDAYQGDFYTLKDGSDSDGKGTVTIDLNGKTYTRKADTYLIDVTVNTSEAALAKHFTVKNGSVINDYEWGPILIKYTSEFPTGVNANISFTFDSVSFVAHDVSTDSDEEDCSPVFWTREDGYTSLENDASFNKCGFVNVEAVFNNCDIVTANCTALALCMPKDSFTEGQELRDRVIYNVTVNGGNITTNGSAVLERNVDADAGADGTPDRTDNVLFGTGSDGAYTTLKIPAASPKPTEVFTSTDGNRVFVLDSTDGTVATYVLIHYEVLNLKIKTNIVFANELLFYTYVPVVGDIAYFTVDGTRFEGVRADVDGQTLKYKVIDGVRHYAIPTNLPAKEAARDIPVTVTAFVGGSYYTVRFTVSTVSYAEKLLASGVSDTQKTLIKDTLAYIKSAYSYFGTAAANADALAKIDTLLTDYTKSFEMVTDESEGLETCFDSTTLLLGARPTIRLYIKSGYEGYTFKFKQSGATISYTTGVDNGKPYIDIGLMAYRLTEAISFTATTRTDNSIPPISGVYHISTYAEWAKTQDAALVDLMEKFYNYAKSALAYKNETQGN